MADAPPLPEDLDQLRAAIEEADRAGAALAAALDEKQFRWQPEGGRGWSVAMCLEHLARTNLAYAGSMRAAVDRARERGWRRHGPIASSAVGRWFVRTMEPPVTRRMRAPAAIVPATATPRGEILADYHRGHRALLDLLPACAGLDVNRAVFPSPFFGLARVRVGTGFRIVAAHDRRHLWQAQRIVDRPDFPGAD